MQRNFFITTIASSILLLLLIVPLGALSHSLKFSAGSILYFALTLYFLIKYPDRKLNVATVMLMPVLLIYIPLHAASFHATILSIPSSVAPLIGIIGAISATKSKGLGIVSALLIVIITCYVQFYGYDRWINFLSYGPPVNERIALPELSFRTKNGEAFGNELFRGKVVVLDFWTTTCGACFQEFPKLQLLSNTYSGSDQVNIYAVNIPLKRDTVNQSYKMLEKFQFSFANLNSNDSLIMKKLNIQFVPMTFIVVDGVIKFIGDIEDVNDKIEGFIKPNHLKFGTIAN